MKRHDIVAGRFKCPVCRKDILFEDNPYRPFCSKRCKMVDLGSWLSEDYCISRQILDHDIFTSRDTEHCPREESV
ncbi:MAG TPA: DNA gyrase inhibitor YacG [Thermodesulfobacteriaceae bacterium]|nr:DNA gyrase inhibitor YacG [Thermodesulfobacteriaceae bacterium]